MADRLSKRMTCSRCGDEMNHHADKLIDPVTAEDRESADSVLGGVIEQIHGCPGCGSVASRREERHG